MSTMDMPSFRRILRWADACFVGLTCLLAASPSSAQESRANSADRVEWRTGADFQKQLRNPTSVEWRAAELRARLMRLAAAHRVAVFLDRRIDPDQEMEFSRIGVPLHDLLGEMAQHVGMRTARLGALIYMGPPRACGLLTVIAPQRQKDVNRHPALARAKPQPSSWGDLAEPRQLLVELAERHHLTVENPEAVPHDLWPAVDLPPLELADQLTLLLVGFDLTFELSSDGTRIRLVPLPADTQYEQAYMPRGDAAQTAAALKRDFPGIAVRREGSRLIVRAGPQEHDRIAERLADGAGERPRGNPNSNVNYTMTVMNESAGAVVSTVAKRLGKRLSFPAGLQEKLSQKVNFQVKEVSLEELLKKTLDPLGLTYRVTAEAIEVMEKGDQ